MRKEVGDLVYIGWRGSKKRPFIGLVLSTSLKHSCGWVFVNNKLRWADLDTLKKACKV